MDAGTRIPPSSAVVGPSVPFSAAALYGGTPSPQPTPTPDPDHAPGTPEPMARTMPRPSAQGIKANPVFALVALVGVALLLIRLTVR